MAWFRDRTKRRIRSDARRLAEESAAFLRGEYIVEIPTVLIPLELAVLSGAPTTAQTPRDLAASILANLPERRPNGPR